jgi:hypothetical protein
VNGFALWEARLEVRLEGVKVVVLLVVDYAFKYACVEAQRMPSFGEESRRWASNEASRVDAG